MIRLILAGKKETARAEASPASENDDIAALPAFSLTDLDGKPIERAKQAGKVVLVEFWATWCPPCRGTLTWLGELKKRHGDKIAVLAIAVESDEAAVRQLVSQLGLPLTWAMGSPDLARQFGDISAVPTLFVFDQKGQTAAVHFGSPPGLHAEAEKQLAGLLGK